MLKMFYITTLDLYNQRIHVSDNIIIIDYRYMLTVVPAIPAVDQNLMRLATDPRKHI